eukprot:GEMP01057235.1.p1 GENE.GEMP01057235.1~~GEMP01057235.1.p1  ORF type:complete len:432 (+),score=99.38 GEMP01057235.1:50-1297(+)
MAQKRAVHAQSKWESLHQLSLLLGQPVAFEKKDIEKIWLMHHAQTPQDTCLKIEELKRTADYFLGAYDVAEGEFPMALQSESFTIEVMHALAASIQGPGTFSSAGFLSHFRQHFLCAPSQKLFRLVVLLLFVRLVYPESKQYDIQALREDLGNALMQFDTVKVGSSISKFYPFFLAEATVYCFHIVFPASAPDFDDAWTVKLYQDVSEEICGFRWHALTIADFRKNFFSKETKKRQNLPSSESYPALSITTNTLSPSLQRHVRKAQLVLPGNPAKRIHFKNPFLEDEVVHLSQSTSAPSLGGGGDEGQRPKVARSSAVQKLEEKPGRKKFVEKKVEIEWTPVEEESRSLSEARGLFTSCVQLLHDHKMMFPKLNARTVLGEMLERKVLKQQKREKERLRRAFQPKRQVHDLKSFE